MIRLTRSQVREVDRRAIEEYGIPGVVLMENAARSATDVIVRLMNDAGLRRAVLLCGGGNNGGDGLAIARHLHNRSLDVEILLTVDSARYQGDAAINWRIVQAMRLPHRSADPGEIAAMQRVIFVDAIFGTGLSSAPREPFGEIVEAVRTSGAPVVAIDVPSGMDCDTGQPLGPCIEASVTVTFVARKKGMTLAAKPYTGEVIVGDIGCPKELVASVLRA